jgi:hypothetical protein
MPSPFQGKGTLFFQNAGSYGWTESYYLQGADYTTCVAQLVDIATARRGILQLDLNITHATVSNIYVRGDSFPATGAIGVGTWPTSAQYMPLDYAIQVNWTAGVYTRNKTFLRGFPLEQQTDGAYVPTSPFITAFGLWEVSVVANALVRQYVPNPTPPPAMVYQFNPITAGLAKFYLARRKSGRPFGLPRGRLVAP